MLDVPLQYLGGRKPDGVADVPGFQKFMQVKFRKDSISLEQEPNSLLMVTLHSWLQDLLPALGAVDVARTKQCSFEIPEMVEQARGVITD